MRAPVIAILLASLLGGCVPTHSPDIAGVGRALDSLLQEHGRFAASGNLEGILSHYTPDAVVRSNHVEPLRGQASLRPFLTGMLAAVHIDSLTYHTDGLAVYGDSAWQIVSYRLNGTMNREPLVDHGSGFILWLRDSRGAWHIHQDIVNSSVPLPTPAPPRKGAA